MRKEPEMCKEYNGAGPWCRAGFIQKPICSGHCGCPHCGSTTDAATPDCQREDLPDYLLNEDGTGRYSSMRTAP